MTAERCGLGSFIPSSCRGRAEAFARRLQSRLRSLGTDDNEAGASNENDDLLENSDSWTNPSTSNTTQDKQPIVSPNSDRFYDFDISDPGSPTNEENCVNNIDGLESGCVLSSPNNNEIDSDNSDVQYFDPVWGEVFADAFSAISPSQTNTDINCDNLNDSQSTCSSQNSIVNVQCEKQCLESKDTSNLSELCCCKSDNSKIILSNTKSFGDSSKNCDLNSHKNTEKILNESNSRAEKSGEDSVTIDSDVKDCIESLCNEIIKQAEIEVSKLRNHVHSPLVIISQAESIDKSPERETILKSKEEINTLFDSLTLKESSDDSAFSTPEEDIPRRVQRSSSLKTGKTPPGTPGRKKIVRFADVLGLDLADIRTFMDEVPKIPKSAYYDLETPKTEITPAQQTKTLQPMFVQPVGVSDFIDRVRTNKVCLENAFQSDSLSITGTVRVLNINFHKSVYIRYTLDNWENFADLQATYVPNSSDGFSDKFSFILYAHTLDIGQRLEFAIKYNTAGQQFWDSNNGTNYVFQCLISPTFTPQNKLCVDSTSPDDDNWSSFY